MKPTCTYIPFFVLVLVNCACLSAQSLDHSVINEFYKRMNKGDGLLEFASKSLEDGKILEMMNCIDGGMQKSQRFHFLMELAKKENPYNCMPLIGIWPRLTSKEKKASVPVIQNCSKRVALNGDIALVASFTELIVGCDFDLLQGEEGIEKVLLSTEKSLSPAAKVWLARMRFRDGEQLEGEKYLCEVMNAGDTRTLVMVCEYLLAMKMKPKSGDLLESFSILEKQLAKNSEPNANALMGHYILEIEKPARSMRELYAGRHFEKLFWLHGGIDDLDSRLTNMSKYLLARYLCFKGVRLGKEIVSVLFDENFAPALKSKEFLVLAHDTKVKEEMEFLKQKQLQRDQRIAEQTKARELYYGEEFEAINRIRMKNSVDNQPLPEWTMRNEWRRRMGVRGFGG